jgi:siroheme synthase-like protein
MKTLPVSLVIEGKLAVVVGAGKVAARKAAALIDAGAQVRVVAKEFAPEFYDLEGFEALREAYKRNHLEGASVVIAATDSPAVNARVAKDARAGGALVNVVDTPDLCDFTFPAVAQRGDVAIAVSTGGASPSLARKLKDEIAGSLDDAYVELAKVLGKVRPRAMKEITDAARRRAYFEKLAGDGFLDLIRSKGQEKALAEALKLLDAAGKRGKRKAGK